MYPEVQKIVLVNRTWRVGRRKSPHSPHDQIILLRTQHAPRELSSIFSDVCRRASGLEIVLELDKLCGGSVLQCPPHHVGPVSFGFWVIVKTTTAIVIELNTEL